MKPGNNSEPDTARNGNDVMHELVMTQDGSYTLYMPEYDQHMHSLSGAFEEALLKHVRPSGILERGADRLAVLDVGFGLGYNVLALVDSLNKRHFTGSLTVISLEKDRALLPALRRISFPDERNETYSFIRNAYLNESMQRGPLYIAVKFGDARLTARTLPANSFDAVFFDPFSPSRNPELWSVDFFSEISRVMKDDAILTTYSCAPQIRGALIEAGFAVGRGPSVGGKREGTLASRTGAITPLPDGDIAALINNFRAVPYRDELLSDDPSSILERRKREMGILRGKKRAGM